MPIEFDPFWKLSDPTWALAMGIPLIAIIAALTYLPARRLGGASRLRYMRILALTSEVLVSVGIIGLITFAARAMIDSDIRRADAASQEHQRQVNVAVWEFARQRCFPTSISTRATQSEIQAVAAACNWWPKLITSPDEFVDWWSAKDEFLQFSRLKDIQPELSGAYATIATRIEAFIRAQDAFARNKHKKKLLEADVSWALIAASTLLGAIGVAFKWTRAALDLTRFSDAKG